MSNPYIWACLVFFGGGWGVPFLGIFQGNARKPPILRVPILRICAPHKSKNASQQTMNNWGNRSLWSLLGNFGGPPLSSPNQQMKNRSCQLLKDAVADEIEVSRGTTGPPSR